MSGIHMRAGQGYSGGMSDRTIPTSDPTDKPPRPRRWIPLSLRIFAAILALLLLAAGWEGWQIYPRWLAIREIHGLSGRIQTIRRGPDWLRSLFGDERMQVFDDVESVSVNSMQLTDAKLKTIAALSDVKFISLSDSPITDEGLSQLQGLTRLTNVCLQGTQVTGRGLVHFRSAPRLIELILDDTAVSDAGLAHLAELSSLQYVRLDRTLVTDAGLRFLDELNDLRELNLNATKVTDQGAYEFNRRRPKLVILRHRDGTPTKSRRELER